jgi:hypothetical protein
MNEKSLDIEARSHAKQALMLVWLIAPHDHFANLNSLNE